MRPQGTMKSGHDMGTVRSVLSISRILPRIHYAHVGTSCARVRNPHPYNLARCSSLVRGHSLRVNVKRDPAVCVPQKLLYGFDIFPIRLEQRAEGMTEGMPTDVLGDGSSICRRSHRRSPGRLQGSSQVSGAAAGLHARFSRRVTSTKYFTGSTPNCSLSS